MKKTKKFLVVLLLLILVILIVGGVWYGKSYKTPRQQAYEHCLAVVQEDNPEQLKNYCSCIADTPIGILNETESKEWWNGYTTGSHEVEEKYINNDELNNKMAQCLINYAPSNTWIMLGLRWCMEQKGEDVKVCGCVLDKFYNDGGPEALKGFIGSQMGFFTLGGDEAEETEEFKNSIEQLFNYCRQNPLEMPKQ